MSADTETWKSFHKSVPTTQCFNAIANCLFSLVNKAFQRYPLVFYYGQSIPMLLLCFLLQTKMTLLLLLMIHASIARDLLVRRWRGLVFKSLSFPSQPSVNRAHIIYLSFLDYAAVALSCFFRLKYLARNTNLPLLASLVHRLSSIEVGNH